jgi:hypothetical protein
LERRKLKVYEAPGCARVDHKKFMGYDKDENGELVINFMRGEALSKVREIEKLLRKLLLIAKQHSNA